MDGADYFTIEELARAFAASEEPWSSCATQLDDVRQWFERNLRFEEAMKLEDSFIGEEDAERAFFRLVHTYAGGPFSFFGKLIDADNLRLFVGRVILREASEGEKRVVDALGDGRLLYYYDEYAKISGAQKDPLLYELLLLMDKKTSAEQWGCFEALQTPDSYIWPKDISRKDTGETLMAMKRMGALPLKREAFEKLESSYALPKVLSSSLSAASSYAEAAKRLEYWKKQELLIPKDPSSHFFEDSCQYEDLSLDEYEQKAMARCWGHTSSILEKLDFVTDGLFDLHEPQNASWVEQRLFAIERLKKLRDQKITAPDSLFVSKTAELLTRRREIKRFIKRFQWIKYPVAGGLGALLARIALGFGHFFSLAFFSVLLLASVYYFVHERLIGRDFLRDLLRPPITLVIPGNPAEAVLEIIVLICAPYLFILLFPRYGIPAAAIVPLIYIMGATSGIAIYHVLEHRATSSYDRDIARLCAEYYSRVQNAVK